MIVLSQKMGGILTDKSLREQHATVPAKRIIERGKDWVTRLPSSQRNHLPILAWNCAEGAQLPTLSVLILEHLRVSPPAALFRLHAR